VRREDLLVAAVALAACAAAFALTFRFTATTPAAMMGGMGAEFFPRLVIGVIAVLAVCVGLGIDGFRREFLLGGERQLRQAERGGRAQDEGAFPHGLLRGMSCLALIADTCTLRGMNCRQFGL